MQGRRDDDAYGNIIPKLIENDPLDNVLKTLEPGEYQRLQARGWRGKHWPGPHRLALEMGIKLTPWKERGQN